MGIKVVAHYAYTSILYSILYISFHDNLHFHCNGQGSWWAHELTWRCEVCSQFIYFFILRILKKSIKPGGGKTCYCVEEENPRKTLASFVRWINENQIFMTMKLSSGMRECNIMEYKMKHKMMLHT